MAGFFDTLINAVSQFVQYIGMMVSSLLSAIGYLILGQTSVTLILGYMPLVVSGACTAFLAVFVIRFLVGR